jgi:hypothetical protein
VTGHKDDQIFSDLLRPLFHEVTETEAEAQQYHDSHNAPNDPKKSEYASQAVGFEICNSLS